MMSKIKKICSVCREEFEIYPYRSLTAKVCSNACSGKLKNTKKERNCKNCGKLFEISPSQFRAYKGAGRYCSRSCSYSGKIKANKDKPIKDKYGRTNRKAAQDWKIAVREKDDYTCQRCGKREDYIHTHHVAPRSRRPDLKYDVSNGKCLCNSCHSWVHNNPLEALELGLLSIETYEIVNKSS
jgi:hypothetical protein